MSDDNPAEALVCPRCRSEQTHTIATSPIEGVWVVYGCKACLYVWRSIEPLENRDPDHYPEAFRLTPERVAEFPVMPVVPPLRGKS